MENQSKLFFFFCARGPCVGIADSYDSGGETEAARGQTLCPVEAWARAFRVAGHPARPRLQLGGFVLKKEPPPTS